MKIALIYGLNDNKLQEDTYSFIYRGMWEALQDEADETTHINFDCDAKDIVADRIIFWDIHSSHHIEIKGIEKHPAIKFEYLDDPHQTNCKLAFRNGVVLHKLGAQQRILRTKKRKIDFIITPYLEGYFKYLSFWGSEAKVLWFPPAPKVDYFTDRYKPYEERVSEILASGATFANGHTFYDFRKQLFKSPNVSYIAHLNIIKDEQTTNISRGKNYPNFLANYQAAIAACETYAVPKYFEIPLAGCVTFMQWNWDAFALGFRHKTNCIFIEPNDYELWFKEFKNDPMAFKHIALAGQKLVENKYTAKHFAKFILGIGKTR